MCRNITPLRGLEPVATPTEIEAAAIAEITTQLLDELPPRQVPPKTVPPLRRRAASVG